MASVLGGTTGRKFDDPCQYFGLDLNVGFMLALQCSELLLHSFDMARAVGREWACPESVADLVLTVQGPVLLTFPFDPAKASDLQASFAMEGG